MTHRTRTTLAALAASLAFGLPAGAQAAPTLVESVQGYTLQDGRLATFTGLVFDQGKVLATATPPRCAPAIRTPPASMAAARRCCRA